MCKKCKIFRWFGTDFIIISFLFHDGQQNWIGAMILQKLDKSKQVHGW